ncbi:dihydrofolate reductase family protein [Spiribacter halobius]|uniref:Bacterial bifunctional deaminase-reductase C-terminal domain-containing protein n=1 Tax=Sediminicurvatus halobius TaxID=2182432 RepID=A0A2U2N5I4_9GAMM|nr:hypothetical protein DEM34_05225 [Spiribacter halobius]
MREARHGEALLAVTGDGSWRCEPDPDAAAATLLDLYLPVCAPPGQRFALAQLGQSLDGRIATPSGHSHYVTGEADRRHLHRLRALVDAVVVGPGTVAADDPRLTVRSVPGPNPVRVVLDPRGALPESSSVYRDRAAATLRIAPPGVAALPGVEQLALDSPGPAEILAALAGRGLHRVLVEGGGRTVSAFLAAGVLDRLHVTVAPVLIGSGRPALSLPEIATMQEALRPPTRRFPLGEDLLFDLALANGASGTGHPAGSRSVPPRRR